MRVPLENFPAQPHGIPSHDTARGLSPCTWSVPGRDGRAWSWTSAKWPVHPASSRSTPICRGCCRRRSHKAVVVTFNPEQAVDFANYDQDHHQTVNKDHRRIQPRRCRAVGNTGHWTCLPRGREPSPRRRCGAQHADPATKGPPLAVQGDHSQGVLRGQTHSDQPE